MTIWTLLGAMQGIDFCMQRLFTCRATMLKNGFQITKHGYHLILIKLLGFILPDVSSFEKQSTCSHMQKDEKAGRIYGF